MINPHGEVLLMRVFVLVVVIELPWVRVMGVWIVLSVPEIVSAWVTVLPRMSPRPNWYRTSFRILCWALESMNLTCGFKERGMVCLVSGVRL